MQAPVPKSFAPPTGDHETKPNTASQEPSRRRARRSSHPQSKKVLNNDQHWHSVVASFSRSSPFSTPLPLRPPLQPPQPRLISHHLGLNRPVQRMAIPLEHEHLNLAFLIPLERMVPAPSLVGRDSAIRGAEEEEGREGYVLGVGEGGDGVQVGVG